ncbi:uncharacterized protein LOC134222296 [Armigeres subalbatus]|uniref:uncharacterized protein LOC134222296 n=1 Tax=Armigeres subalbatus TaxID=124917 RepID=UPI002ED45B23
MNTVTYGTAAAPYLATRAIVQLAKDEQDKFPAASDAVLKSFYIDDVLDGADTLQNAQQLQRDLVALLARGGFELHKWCANNITLLEDIPAHAHEKQLKFDESGVIKTLGILWDPTADAFMFRVKPVDENTSKPTKRLVLSETAKLFDPLGFLAPTVIIAKMIMQRLWSEKTNWDDPLPADQLHSWMRLRSELCSISSFKIDRRLTADDVVTQELHGFADASMLAYGCCIYLRSVTMDGSVKVCLICAKSKVAPMKEQKRVENLGAEIEEITIPRLELCAALLLAEQMKNVREALAFDTEKVVLRAVSKIVLC